jgi:hypothetical protein
VLTGFWERLRGLDKWTSTEATVESCKVRESHFGATQSVCKISWRDNQGSPQSGKFKVDEESPLFQLIEGDKVSIRFNPQRPAQFHLSGIFRSRLVQARKSALYALMILLAMVALAVAWFGPNILNFPWR